MTFVLIVILIIAIAGAVAFAYLFVGAQKSCKDYERKMALQAEESAMKVKDLTREFNESKEKLDAEIINLRKNLQENMTQIQSLKQTISGDSFDGFFPICSNCKDIRDGKGSWHSIEEYIQNLSAAEFSHSLCQECAKKLYPDLFDGERKSICLKWKPGSDKPF